MRLREAALKYPKTNVIVAASAAALSGWAVLRVGALVAGGRYFVMWVLLILLTLTIAIPIATEVAQGEFDLFNLKNIFLLYIFMQFVVWPISAYTGIYDLEPLYGFKVTCLTWRYWAFLEAELYVFFGLLAFYVGYYLLRGKESARTVASGYRQWSAGRLVFMSGAMVVASLWAFVHLTAQNHGFLYFVTHIDQFRNTDLLGVGYLTAAISLAQIASLALLCFYFETGRLRFTSHGLLLLAIVLSLVGASRMATVDAIVSYLVARNYLKRPLRLNLKNGAMLSALWVLNVTYVYFRRFGLSTYAQLRGITVGTILFLIVPRFTGGESLARVIDVTGQTGFQGAHYIVRDLLSAWVPRVLWPAKPLSAGLIENVAFFPDAFTGGETGAAVPTLYGELYWIAGILGILVGMLILGLLFRRAYRLVESKDKNAIGLYCMVYMFAFFVNETLSVHLVRFLLHIFIWVGLMQAVRKRSAARAIALRASVPVP